MPYCVADRPSNGISSGRPSTIRTPRIAVKEIDEATSSPSAPITGATAAIAELPQIELPQAIRIDSFGRQAEHPAEAVADRQHDDDGGDDRRDQQIAGRHDRGKADGGAEQHDGDLEQLFGAEGNAGAPALGRLPGGANRHPEQDRDDERFDIGVGEDALFDQLGAKRNGGDGAAEGDAGNEGQAAAERARVRLYPVRLVLSRCGTCPPFWRTVYAPARSASPINFRFSEMGRVFFFRLHRRALACAP